ncbi:FtsX-like permease family protein [Thermococcus sp. 21S7]|uniref:ABC transporter permease n=1 Tax=Thermococcus sp. 21S7 TaxID=1638221 RepID=UPI001438A963|nr:FtsX-like permease family protein [Thermococcus sp. 21S7]NJE61984.1 ABC transporter permease [Thermococcus sp. 21S7]
MKLRAVLRKLGREKKKAVVIFLTFFIVSLGINYTLSAIGGVLKAFEGYTAKGNVDFDAKGVSIDDLREFGEIINYMYYNTTIVKIHGREFHAMVGYGEFSAIKEKPSGNEVIVLGMNDVKRGEEVEINGKFYTVKASYYFPSGTPIILMNEKGRWLYVFMNSKNPDELARYLEKHAQVRYFKAFEGEQPYMDVLKNAKNFLMSFFYLLLGAAISVIVLTTIAHVKSGVREIGIHKALGLPNSFIFLLFAGDYLLMSLTAYVLGMLPGLWLGYHYSYLFIEAPIQRNYSYALPYDITVLLLITLLVIFPGVYIVGIRPIDGLRFVPKRTSVLRFFAVFFVISLASLSAYMAYIGITNVLNDVTYSFNLKVYGDPEVVGKLPGEKVGILTGQQIDGVTVTFYFVAFNSTIGMPLKEGRWLRKENEAVIGIGLAKELGLKVGDTLRLKVLGEEKEYRIVGISRAPFSNFRVIFLPKIKAIPDNVAFLKVEDPEAKKFKYERMRLYVKTVEDIKGETQQNVSLFRSMIFGLIVMILIVALFALFALIYLEIEGNEKVYATLKAVGIPNSYVWREFLKKAIPSLIISSLLALPISLKVGEYIGNIVLPVELGMGDLGGVAPLLLVLYLLYGVFIVLLTERALNRLDVVKALRS